MAELRTEEEQVEALKNWWKENGKSLMLGIAAALAIVFGYKGWQSQQQAQAENAAVLYQNLVQAVAIASAPHATDEQRATASHLVGTLKDDYSDSAYARFAAMLGARLAVDKGDYSAAVTELDWVLANSRDAVMKVVASMRKARLMAAQGDTDAALALLNGLQEQSFQVSLEELKGDLYLQANDRDQARAAYQQAVSLATEGARPVLQMKLDNLAVEEG